MKRSQPNVTHYHGIRFEVLGKSTISGSDIATCILQYVKLRSQLLTARNATVYSTFNAVDGLKMTNTGQNRMLVLAFRRSALHTASP